MIGQALLLAGTFSAMAQTPRDQGAFRIRIDTVEVARETYAFGPSRLSGGAAGWVIDASTSYDHVRPTVVFSSMLEISADSLPVTLQFNVANPRDPVRILGQLGRNRFSVRTVARGLERAREFPLRAPAVVLDDSVFALYQIAAWFARPTPVTVTAVVARAARRDTLILVDSGSATVTVGRRDVSLRHLVLTGGPNQLVHLWLDPTGRLVRLTIPSRSLVAEREPTD